MAGWVAVLVDNKELVRVARLREGESGVLNLTTMLPEQDRVDVEIYLVNGRSSERVQTFRTEGVRRGEPRPRIVVSAHVHGALAVSLRIDGELVATAEVDLPAEMTASRRWPLVAILAGAVLVGALAWGAWSLAGGAGSFRSTPDLALESRGPAEEPRGATAERPPPPQVDEAEAHDDPSTREEAAPTRSSQPPGLDVRVAVYFEPDSAVLSPAARDALDAFAVTVHERVALGGDSGSILILLDGHTALYGNEPGRLALSSERAAQAARFLTARLRELGIDDVSTSATGRGGSDPVTRVETEQWRNRRVEITVETDGG